MDIAYCSSCGEEFIQKTATHTTCPKKECRHFVAQTRRKTSHFDSQRLFAANVTEKKAVDRNRTNVVKKAILHDMKKQNGYQYCEACGPERYCKYLELHHIVFRSEIPGHPQKHSKINSILLCHEHHEWFHAKKNRRDYLIVERRLWEVFPDTIRKEYYNYN